jgi:hypothetical protein
MVKNNSSENTSQNEARLFLILWSTSHIGARIHGWAPPQADTPVWRIS